MQIASRQCLWNDTIGRAGTILVVEASDACMRVVLASGALAAGSTSVTVSWGDGKSDEYTRISNAEHTYARPGEYMIIISDG